MITTQEALKSWEDYLEGGYCQRQMDSEGNVYEVRLEPLLFDGQWYLAFYKNQELIGDKVAVKIGFDLTKQK